MRMVLKWAVILFLTCVLGTADAASSKITREKLEKAKNLYKELFPDADKKDVSSDGKLVLSKKDIASMKEAISDMQEVIRKFPDNKAWCAKSQKQIGEIYKDMGEYQTAIAEYNKVLANYPSQKEMCIDAASAIDECNKLLSGGGNSPITPAGDSGVQTKSIPEGPLATLKRNSGPVSEEYVFHLANGRSIKGEILKETDKSITIRFSGNTIEFEKSEIKSREKTGK